MFSLQKVRIGTFTVAGTSCRPDLVGRTSVTLKQFYSCFQTRLLDILAVRAGGNMKAEVTPAVTIEAEVDV